jgi:hypothetical protein
MEPIYAAARRRSRGLRLKRHLLLRSRRRATKMPLSSTELAAKTGKAPRPRGR